MTLSNDQTYRKHPNVVEYESVELTYVSGAVNKLEVGNLGRCSATLSTPGRSNYFTIKFKPTISLSYYEVRITPDATHGIDDYDIGVGKLAYVQANIEANKTHTFRIDINQANFSQGGKSYRIAMYARNSLDNSWDVSYLFFSSDGLQFIAKTDEPFESLTDRIPPTV